MRISQVQVLDASTRQALLNLTGSSLSAATGTLLFVPAKPAGLHRDDLPLDRDAIRRNYRA